MGYALCRFRKETNCDETGSQTYWVNLPDQNVNIDVPSMWKHYMEEHLVQPSKRERDVVMAADPSLATGKHTQHRSMNEPEHVKIMYVEKTDKGYTHEVGVKPDTDFIKKLESILNKINPLQSKGFGDGFR